MLLLLGFAGSRYPLLEAASVHHGSWPPEADWIRWAGVATAVTGALIATPDGTLAAWHGMTRAGNRIRDRLARYLPFLRRTTHTEPKQAADAGVSAERMCVSRRIEWNARAGDKGKIELLHQQVDLLGQELTDVRQEIQRVEASLRSALERTEVRLQDAHQQVAGRLEARERREARVDAHGIWPIGAGIVLTGLPDELAAVAVLGWLSIAAGFALAFWAARAVMTDQAIRDGSAR
jgi:hypothetical protein